jgi:hypothetical protein
MNRMKQIKWGWGRWIEDDRHGNVAVGEEMSEERSVLLVELIIQHDSVGIAESVDGLI